MCFFRLDFHGIMLLYWDTIYRGSVAVYSDYKWTEEIDYKQIQEIYNSLI